jgi:hypothetical protein
MKFETEFACSYPGIVYTDERSFPKGWVGPNVHGERFKPVKAVYDTEAQMTRVVFELFRGAA